MGLVIQKPKGTVVSPVAESFQQLTASADKLNEETVRLAKVVDQLNAGIRKLNLGVSAWVQTSSWSDEEGRSGNEYLGWTKVKDGWGLAIRSDVEDGRGLDDEMTWAFSDAKREMRLSAVKHIPALIEELNRNTMQFTSALAAETQQAELLAVMVVGHAFLREKGVK